MDEMAIRLHNLHRLEQALEINQKCTQITKKLLGEEHALTLRRLTYQAVILSAMGRHDDARKIREMVYQINRKTYGKNHMETLQAMTCLAMEYESENLFEKAFQLMSSVCEISGVSYRYSKEYTMMLKYLCKLAVYLQNINEYQKIYIKVKADYKDTLEKYGKHHFYTEQKFDEYSTVQSNLLYFRDVPNEVFAKLIVGIDKLAAAEYKKKNYGKAIELEEKVYFACKNAFGENHQYTTTALERLRTFGGKESS
jgi:tetratricopeptide (TPR) repeat protein